MNKGMGLLAFGLVMVLAVGTARADYMVYTDRATFEAALSSETTETFNELGGNIHAFPSGLSQANGLTQPLTITGSGNYLLSGNSATFSGFYQNNGTYIIGALGSTINDGVTVSLPANTFTAAGADVSNFTASGLVSFTGTTSQGETFSGNVSVNGADRATTLGFLGVTTTSPDDFITSLKFSAQVGSNVNVVVDNVSFGQAVPEPASMALFASGALVLGGGALLRRFRKVQG
jgi:PEP-CTERM motif